VSDPKTDVTGLLKRHTDGDPEALAELIPLVYKELQKLASYYLQGERPGHTLQTTALVHEAYMRLVDRKEVDWKDRSHFFAVAAQTMRRILVDYARKHRAKKRGGSALPIRLDQSAIFSKEQAPSHLVIDELLTKLAKLDPKGAQIVELRFFAGLSVAQTAEVVQLSPATVKREWSVAKAWLTREMKNSDITKEQ
jgi:RNA polymerase sigma factor (TIGR02999 family)